MIFIKAENYPVYVVTTSEWEEKDKKEMTFNYVLWLGWQGIYGAAVQVDFFFNIYLRCNKFFHCSIGIRLLVRDQPCETLKKTYYRCRWSKVQKRRSTLYHLFDFTFFLFKIINSLYWRATDPHTYILWYTKKLKIEIIHQYNPSLLVIDCLTVCGVGHRMTVTTFLWQKNSCTVTIHAIDLDYTE